jgi:hypothetical protein
MKYRSYGRLDDQILEDGDGQFLGINSFVEPTTLKEGFVSNSENLVFDGDTATLRDGLLFKAGSVTLTYSTGSSGDRIFASTSYKDPSTGTEYLAFATKSKLILYNEATASGVDIDYPVGEVVAEADNPSLLQSFTKLILFRGTGKQILEWSGNQSEDFLLKTETASNPSAGTAMPRVEFGLSFRNRIVVPFPSDSNYSLTFSDIIDDNQFATTSTFRINKGSADKLVGFHPYLENQLLIFMERSIHLISDVANIDSSSVFEITREFGCVSRRSIVNSGPQIYFLSDRGIMVLQQGLDPAKGLGVAISKVSGEAKPLSESIDDQFKKVNLAAASGAVSKVHENKVYFAVPTGSSTTNNKIFVFNILNNAFESIYDFPSGFQIDDMVELPFGSNPQRRELFLVAPTGWYQLTGSGATTDDSGRFVGSSSESGTTAITGKLKSRSFTLGDRGVKHWKGGQIAMSMKNNDAIQVSLETKDPDNASTQVLSHTASSTEDTLFRFGGRRRGYSASVQVSISAGNPTIRHLLMQGAVGQLGARRNVA